MQKALLIIDVQKSSVNNNLDVVKNIENLQKQYENIFISRFVNENSPLLDILNWDGYDDETLAFNPDKKAVIFDKNIYSSFIKELSEFDEVHLCGFDTDACVYKTAMDLVEFGIKPVVLSKYCGSENEEYHQMGITLLKRNIGKDNVI